MPERKIELIGPGFKIHSVTGNNPKVNEAEYVGPVCCPDCNSTRLERPHPAPPPPCEHGALYDLASSGRA